MNFVLYRPQLKDDSDNDNDYDNDNDNDDYGSHADHHEMVGLNHRIQATPEGSIHSSSAAGGGGGGGGSSSFGFNSDCDSDSDCDVDVDSRRYYSPRPQSRASLPAWYRSPIGRRRSRPSLVCSRLPAALKSAWCVGILVVVATAILVATVPAIVSVPENNGKNNEIVVGDTRVYESDAMPPDQKTRESVNYDDDEIRFRHHQSPPNHDPVEILESVTSGTEGFRIPYLHVAATDKHRGGKPKHVVLLHGAAFDKETWRTSGILSAFGTRTPWLSVTAVDLPVSADYRKLVAAFKDLAENGLVGSFPVTALVTPSASGRSVTSWICNNNNNNNNNNQEHQLPPSEITHYFRLWIPVASYAVLKCPEEDLSALTAMAMEDTAAAPSLAVAAVYGNRDGKGRTVSEKLGKHAGATVYELEGKHPVYLDEPLKFVDVVATEISKL